MYRNGVDRLSSGLKGGEVVRVLDGRGYYMGQALYSSASQISLRWLTVEDEPIDAAFFQRRIASALELRKRAYPGVDAYRVVHADGDLLPGLVVDRFGDCLVAQFLVQGTEALKELILDALMEVVAPKAIINRSDSVVRLLESLPLEKGLVRGAAPERVRFHEGDIEFSVDLFGGQKTGAFLDQRDNHLRAGEWARGDALDCFSYAGGFALQLARKATSVTAVEISEPACAELRRNAEANGLMALNIITENAFDVLAEQAKQGPSYDTIVLDPPSFAKKKDSIAAAIRGYKELNLRAFQLLRPGGILVTCSCSHHLDDATFEQLLDDAAADAKRNVQVLERRGAGVDHPVLVGLRETRYLKCYFLRVQ